jgi:hypothetical protein
MSFANQDMLHELNLLGSTITHDGTTFVLVWDSQSSCVKVMLCNIEKRQRDDTKSVEHRPRDDKKPFEHRPRDEKKAAEGDKLASRQPKPMVFEFQNNEPFYVTKNFNASATKFFKKLDAIPDISDKAIIIAENSTEKGVEPSKRIIFDPANSKYYMEEKQDGNAPNFYIYTFVHKPKDQHNERRD